MARRKRRPNPQPAAQQPILRMTVPNFHPPIPVQPGDQVVTRFTADGPLITRVLRDGKQIWPELLKDNV